MTDTSLKVAEEIVSDLALDTVMNHDSVKVIRDRIALELDDRKFDPNTKVGLTEAAVNCLKFWQEHEMYGGSLSDVICKQMLEWLNRDMTTATGSEIEAEFEAIKRGKS